MKNYSCPNCGEKFEMHESINGDKATPDPGDTTICAHCAAISVFTEDGIRRANMEDMIAMPTEVLAQLLQAKLIIMAHLKEEAHE